MIEGRLVEQVHGAFDYARSKLDFEAISGGSKALEPPLLDI